MLNNFGSNTAVPNTDPTPLCIGVADGWVQSGTSITVNAVKDQNNYASATAYSERGGTLIFRGDDSARFGASLTPSGFASTLTLQPGTTTIYINVAPTDSDTTLNAIVGVPL